MDGDESNECLEYSNEFDDDSDDELLECIIGDKSAGEADDEFIATLLLIDLTLDEQVFLLDDMLFDDDNEDVSNE